VTQKQTKKQLNSAKGCERLLRQVFGRKIKWRPRKKMRPRPVTTKERAWLVRGLESLRTGEYVGCHSINLATGKPPPPGPPRDPQPYLDQLDKLIVVSRCNCGLKNCHTVAFQGFQKGKIRTLVMHNTKDGRWLIITAHEDTNELTELEVII